MTTKHKRTVDEKESAFTQESFDKLLAWLHPDREQAGQRYEDIRRKLIKLFLSRGCNQPEELTDETINRVAQKIDKILEEYVGDPEYYFFAVARRVCRGSLPPRKEAAWLSTPAPLP